jgi:OPA family glycerol-3-phosphate transporter-like MFS transporter
VAALLYGVMLAGALLMVFTYQQPWVGWLVIIMSLAVIGVHGMLSGTASMDFGGSKNAGIAVGLIDGFVYLGTGLMSFTYALILPRVQVDDLGNLTGPATDPANWQAWPISMVPLALIGLLLAWRIRGAKPKAKVKQVSDA